MTDSLRSRFQLPHWGWCLFVGVSGYIVLAVFLPWHREQEVILLIESWGGSVVTDANEPKWLRKIVGNEVLTTLKRKSFLNRVTGVTLTGRTVTDARLSHLNRLMKLRRLALTNSAITDAGLAQLGELTSIQELYLSRTDVTDAGLARLSGLNNLKIIHLNDTAVTGEGLACKALTIVELKGAKVTDAGLTAFGRLTNLRILNLEDQPDDAAISDRCVKGLKNTRPNCRIRHWRITHHGGPIANRRPSM